MATPRLANQIKSDTIHLFLLHISIPVGLLPPHPPFFQALAFGCFEAVSRPANYRLVELEKTIYYCRATMPDIKKKKKKQCLTSLSQLSN